MKSELSGAPPPAPNSLLLRVACVVGLCVTGDSLLYTLLPLEAENLGFSAYQLGLLLSVNRLIRLVSNSGAVLAFERTGTRSPFLIATLASLLTTISYGFGTGFLVFLLARIFWGIAWSGLRLGGYQAVWTGPEGGRGRLSGLLWGVIRMGSALSVVCGGYLRDRFGYLSAISAISLVTALAIPVALSIRWPQRLQKLQKSTFSPGELGQAAVGDSRGQILLAVSLLMGFLEGVLISTAALFVAARLQAASETGSLLTSTATIAGLLLATRWTSDMVFGPAIGVFSDRVGQSRTLTLLSAVLLACLTAATGGAGTLFPLLAFSIGFAVSSGFFVTMNAAATVVAAKNSRPHLYLGTFATANDAGTAVGPLLAYLLSAFTGFGFLYVATSVILFLVVLGYRPSDSQTKRTGATTDRSQSPAE